MGQQSVGSEYMGSESAVSLGGPAVFQPPTGMTGGTVMSMAMSEDGGGVHGTGTGTGAGAGTALRLGGALPFGRSQSYTLENSHEITPTSASGSFFDSTTNNRRRTSTMSPPGLSHLMENEPFLNGVSAPAAWREELSIPMFDGPLSNGQFGPYGPAASPLGSRVSSPTNLIMGNAAGAGGRFRDRAAAGDPLNLDGHDAGLSFGAPNRPDLSGVVPNQPGLGSGGRLSLSGNAPGSAAVGLSSFRGGFRAPPGGGAGGLAGVFRSPGDSTQAADSLLAVPGRELTLSSTASSGGRMHVHVSGGVMLGAKSWGGPTAGADHHGQAATPSGTGQGFQDLSGRNNDSYHATRLEQDLNALLNFSDHPADGSSGHHHQRAPSLVSKIDPELRVVQKDAAAPPGDRPLVLNPFSAGGAPAVASPSIISSDDPVFSQSIRGRSYSDGRVIGRW